VQAQKSSAEYRERLEREVQDKLNEAAKKVGELGKAKGVSPDAMRQINAALGVAA